MMIDVVTDDGLMTFLLFDTSPRQQNRGPLQFAPTQACLEIRSLAQTRTLCPESQLSLRIFDWRHARVVRFIPYLSAFPLAWGHRRNQDIKLRRSSRPRRLHPHCAPRDYFTGNEGFSETQEEGAVLQVAIRVYFRSFNFIHCSNSEIVPTNQLACSRQSFIESRWQRSSKPSLLLSYAMSVLCDS
jgi:hypothetical protein